MNCYKPSSANLYANLLFSLTLHLTENFLCSRRSETKLGKLCLSLPLGKDDHLKNWTGCDGVTLSLRHMRYE